MGLFKKRNSGPPATKEHGRPTAQDDPRYPGRAGYSGNGLKKNAMPENRFQYVRPEDQRKR